MRACLLADNAENRKLPSTAAYRAIGEQLDREMERDPAVSVASQIASTWSQHASQAYAARRKEIWRGDMSLPSYRKDAPIMVRKDSWDIERDGKGYAIATRLTAGKTGRYRFAVTAEGGSAHAILRALVDPTTPDRHGDLKIKYDERKKRWFALLTVIRPKPATPQLDAARKIAVHRGMRTLLTWATSEGKSKTIDDGGRVVAFKSQMHKRRRQWYAHKKNTPARARGRGSWRRYEQYRALEDKEERFMHTCLQQNAAAVVKAAIANGCGTIVMDDWGARETADRAQRDDKAWLAQTVRSWPFAAQRAAIEWAARKAGVAVEVVASSYESIHARPAETSTPSKIVGAAASSARAHRADCADRQTSWQRGTCCMQRERRTGLKRTIARARTQLPMCAPPLARPWPNGNSHFYGAQWCAARGHSTSLESKTTHEA